MNRTTTASVVWADTASPFEQDEKYFKGGSKNSRI